MGWLEDGGPGVEEAGFAGSGAATDEGGVAVDVDSVGAAVESAPVDEVDAVEAPLLGAGGDVVGAEEAVLQVVGLQVIHLCLLWVGWCRW
ncbi:Uncharacterised protein [Dermatophilus congolensis]|uniref:Uncharacterized protein n=1 Tax=Dermatophilus congolensis TaxID=1863 RepID=A0AA46BPS5_9MICO|nr:hypothetical protein [Dermatophilus congolensis]STD13969.1 Uncharacterised protein [Dermatophilus congolensis]